MKIYVASSWRNEFHAAVVEALKSLGHEVYDFKHPPHGKGGFSWAAIDTRWESWTTEQYREALNHKIAKDGFNSDFGGMTWADCCLMVLPCGRSAHSEAGWFSGAGKPVYVFSPLKQEPELMYKLYDGIIADFEELHNVFSMIEDGNRKHTEVKGAGERTEA